MAMKRPTGELALLFGFADPQRMRKVKSALLCMGVRSRTITAEEALLPLGTLAGMQDILPAQDNPTEGEITEEMLVLHRFSGKRLDELLQRLRKNGAGNIACKAVLTEHNIPWNGVRLLAELQAEHQAMQEGRTAHPQKMSETV